MMFCLKKDIYKQKVKQNKKNGKTQLNFEGNLDDYVATVGSNILKTINIDSFVHTIGGIKKLWPPPQCISLLKLWMW